MLVSRVDVAAAIIIVGGGCYCCGGGGGSGGSGGGVGLVWFSVAEAGERATFFV